MSCIVTVGKFIAALSIASQQHGQVANIYSTSLDRAVELLKAARQYIEWMMTDDGKHNEWTYLAYAKNTHTMYSLKTEKHAIPNDVTAKPKNPDSCRGKL